MGTLEVAPLCSAAPAAPQPFAAQDGAACGYRVTLEDPSFCGAVGAPAPPAPPPAPPAAPAGPAPDFATLPASGVYSFNATALDWLNRTETFEWRVQARSAGGGGIGGGGISRRALLSPPSQPRSHTRTPPTHPPTRSQLPAGPVTQCLLPAGGGPPSPCVTAATTLAFRAGVYASADGDSALCATFAPRALTLATACGADYATSVVEAPLCVYAVRVEHPAFCGA